MSLRYIRSLCLVFLLGVLLGCLEVSVIPFFSNGWNLFRVILPALVLLVFVEETQDAIVLAIGSGIVLDLFSVGGGSFAIARLLLIVFALQFLGKTLLTNQSLYTALAMALSAGLIDVAWRFFAGAVGDVSELWKSVVLVSVFVSVLVGFRVRVVRSLYGRSPRI